ncbi:MAG: VanZ family protein, partial [Gammaproteobacteria bacterium]|nr:VanZ family protein [Gammaproteobacteria bacterium]
TSLSYPVNIDNNNEHLNLTTQIKTDNLDHGNIYWETIRISVYFYDINMQLIKETKHTARYIYGDHDWLFLNKSFLIPPHASYAKASFEFRNSSGKLSVKNTSLKYASEKPNYILTRYTLLFTWIYFISLFIISLIKDITLFQYKFLFLFIIVTIIIAIALPGDIKTIITSHLIQNTELNTRTYDNKGVLNQLKDPMKLGHYTAFLLFSLISLVSLTRKYNHIVIIINLILLSIITEVIQILVAERTPQINDIFIDCYGIITGFIIYTIYFYTIKRINLIENNEKSTSIKK